MPQRYFMAPTTIPGVSQSLAHSGTPSGPSGSVAGQGRGVSPFSKIVADGITFDDVLLLKRKQLAFGPVSEVLTKERIGEAYAV